MAIGRKAASSADLMGFLRWADAYGFRIAEHPAYGGVHPVHTSGSWHYDGLAADLNYGPPGAPASERRAVRYAINVAQSMGLGCIYALHGTHGSAAGHRGHLHVDVSASTNLGDRYRTTPPGDRRVQRFQGALRFLSRNRDNLFGNDTEREAEKIRKASTFHGNKFPYGVKEVQQRIGVKADGKWGPVSAKAHDRIVKRMQKSLGVKADGVWGSKTDAAYLDLRRDKRRR